MLSLAAVLLISCSDGGRVEGTRFGPYRLLPPGSELENRVIPPALREGFGETTDHAVIMAAAIYIAPPDGFEAVGLRAATVGDEVVAISHEWVGPGGTVTISTLVVDEDQLPIDIVRETSGGRITVQTATLAGREAIITVPGPTVAPSLGAVRVWLGGWEMVLVSTVLDIEALRALAERLAAGAEPLPE